MNKERLYIFDTTLRDGAQTQGVDFSVDDKLKIALALDNLGVDYIEGGWPGANPTDTEFFQKKHEFVNSKLTSFGMTKRSGRSADNDPGLSALSNANTPAVCLVGKSWDFHVDIALGISNEENLKNISESTKHFVKEKKEFLFDAEHFFDGYKANSKYAISCLKSALDEGARWIVLCDTNGGTLPHEITKIVNEVIKVIPGKNLGIHAHNDTGNAVANSLAAVWAGVRHIQGTINGLGERCGNANLMSLIPTFFLKKDFSSKFELQIKPENIKNLTECSRLLDEILNRKPNKHLPYVGAAAFSHKGGLHVSAVQKDPKTYEHINPEEVGNSRNIVVSDQSGKSNIISRLKTIGIEIKESDPKIKKLLDEVKDREFIGYSYDGADASFELLARRIISEIPRYILIQEYDVSVKKDSYGKIISSARAQLEVDGEKIVCEGEGNGPVNALDNAIRQNVDKLNKYTKYLKDLKLVDYKVRILNTGTEAITRVSIESTDSKGKNWFTIGVSANIIDASFKALVDSLDYKLFKDKAPASK
ncbi:2-isopropylmalate synthase [Candidatus Pelagibacter ubique]|uniref:Citramalate synthase n=1 Tax=Pelagibacter ubique TaxID=198252 RepID=A0ABX1T2L9_PELUQ|nr:citramalate synthase [Candidatus Pelagibacter ubique]NMN67847.1 2-isopropylmalate synthase [Candidatus Pelagibacter ubique]